MKIKLVEVVREGTPDVSVESITRPTDAYEFLKDLREKMKEHFRRASRYEWMFWDSAYGQRRWPPT